MPYEHQTERIELGEGHYTVMFEHLKHGTERRVKEIGRQYLRGKDGINPTFKMEDKDGEQKGSVSGEFEIDLERFDDSSGTDCMILMQTIEWSFGPIVQETIDDLPIEMRDQINDWMVAHYQRPKVESGADESAKASSSPSRRERRHPPK